MPIVHGVGLSPFVRKVRAFLVEKGISYDLKPLVPLNVPEDFRRISPLGKIPVFEEGAFTVPDSSVICAYLERVNPEPALYPSDPKDYARALYLEEYADTRLAEFCGTLFFQRRIRKSMLKEEPDEALCQQRLQEDLPPLFDYLEGQVGKGDVVGNAFSIADISIATQIQQLRHGGEDVDPSRWPKLRAYLDRVLGRPSFAALIEQEREMLASM